MRNVPRKPLYKAIHYLVSGAATLALLPGLAYGQDAPATKAPAETDAQMETFDPGAAEDKKAPAQTATTLEEIVVTGTQMRGVEPVGAQIIAMELEDVAATGAVTTAELLATIPQNSSFGTTPSVDGSNNIQLTVNRVNLRNLPQGIGAASPTLILMNGHRLVGVGIGQNYPDPDVVPPGALQRVEVLTEGGSSVYGADAIGGVVNFITRRDIDGTEVGVRQGFGDSFDSTDVNLTTGRDWGDTSAFASYNYSQNDSIHGGDRNYVKKIDWATGVPVDLACNPGNVTVGADTWAINPQNNTLTPGTSGKCDTTKYDTIYPEIERNTFFAGVTHDLTDRLEFDLQSWYTKRENTSDEGPLEGFTTVSSNNPNYISTGGATANATQNVAFNFAPFTGNHQDQNTNLEEWGFTPTLRWDIGHEWQMRAYYNYGYSETDFKQQEVDAVVLNNYVATGVINPYNIAASNSGAIANTLNRYQVGRGEQELNNFKAVFDGPVYELPGGEVRIAVGTEYIDESYEGGTLTDVAGASIPMVDANRDVKAGFAEVNIPVVGFDNQLPGVYEITLAAAYRYDDYSDFGDTDSPNYALTYRPIEWLALRGRWNEAFQAPGLADLANANSTILALPFIPGVIINPAVPVQPGQWLLAAQGTQLPLDPQTSQNYNVGFDLEVPFVEGLEISASYYHIEYEGQISIPPVYDPGVFYPNFPDNYIMLPSQQTAEAYLVGAGVPQGEVDNALAQVGTAPLYAVVDTRRTNLGKNTFGGYDLFIQYDVDTSFGSVFSSFNGTYLDNAKNQPFDGAPQTQNAGYTGSRFNYTFGLGARIGDNITVQGTLYYVDDYNLRTPAELNQTKVDSWNTLDLFAQYSFPGVGGWTENLALTLGVNNVFDEDPPEYRGTSAGNTSGYVGGTLGQVVQLGFTKTF
jgi:iron complex outermembrane receptor protein